MAEAVFAGTVVVMLGTSALYHRIAWTPEVRAWLRRSPSSATPVGPGVRGEVRQAA